MEHGVSGDTEGTLGIRIQFKIRKQHIIPRHRTVDVLDTPPTKKKKKKKARRKRKDRLEV
jgi:hypothetical protein